ncbi:MAG TPA: hypothetical protein VJN96_07300 [Vicinamibacterales bacterium]|nr:hypothetical protein [Vicinamibacterales bacterium]
MPRHYRVYGLTLRTPLSLPIPAAPVSTHADLLLRPARAAEFPSSARRPRSWFRYRALPDGAAHLEWRGLFEFLVSPDGGTVRYRRLARASDRSLGTYLLGHVLSFSLVARGAEPLHGTAVTVGGEAVVFLGECGDGKSTLGAAMIRRGAKMLSDDLIAIHRRGRSCLVQPGPARLKLYRHVARAVIGRRREWPMHADTAKLVVPVRARERARRPVRLRAFYVLARGRDIRIDTLSPGAAVVELLRSSFNLTVDSRSRERTRFKLAAALARSVPVKRLTYPRSLAALPKVCDTVLRDLRL